jgi:hypothetical protein
MRITIEVEPVLYKSKHEKGDYYAFRIIGLPDVLGDNLDVRSTSFHYPGNDAVRKFINERSAAQELLK